MARIRTIKPEFWTSGQVLECSRNARLLFLGLWNFCDDLGRHPWRPKQIKAEVFPADDDITVENVLGMLQELSKNGLIKPYTVDDIEYFVVTGWHHQRIDKPQDPKYPPPSQTHSTNIPRTVPPDRKGKDRRGEEKKEGGASAPTYAFEGRVIRLSEEHLAEWTSAYREIPDVRAELTAADAYYVENPPKDGKWFFPASQWLKRENDKRLASKRAENDVYRGVQIG